MAVNGVMDSALRSPIADQPGQSLRIDAAISWEAVQRECAAAGVVLHLTDSYRPLAVQERIFRERYVTHFTGIDHRIWRGVNYWRRPGTASAAVPGTSNHGWGIAVDCGVGSFTSKAYRALSDHGPGHGWTNTAGRQIQEPWHWEYNSAHDQHPSPVPTPKPTPKPTPEDDMPLNPADLDAVGERVKQILRAPEFQTYLRDVPWAHPISGSGMGPAAAEQWLADTRQSVLDISNVVHGLAGQVTALAAQIAALGAK